MTMATVDSTPDGGMTEDQGKAPGGAAPFLGAQGKLTGIALALLAALFVSINVLAAFSLTSFRVDLTQDQLYSLSPATMRVLREVEEPITLRFYYSQRLGSQNPTYGVYADRVRDMLQEYADRSDGKIVLEIYDPEPFTPVEDRAVSFGLQSVALEGGDGNVFFGLVGTNTTDDVEALPFFQPDREAFLEYDITKMIYALSQGTTGKVGILGNKKITMDVRMGQGGRPEQLPPALVTPRIEEVLDVEELDEEIELIPDDISILMVIHPKRLAERTRFAIDQYILGGGKAVIFVDPYSEADGWQAANGPVNGASSTLSEMFDAWGLEMPTDKIVGDRFAGRRVGNGTGSGYVTYVPWLLLRGPNLDKNSPVTAQVDSVAVASAGYLKLKEGSPLTLDPLLTSSPGSTLFDVKQVATQRPNPQALLNAYQAGAERFVIAGRLSGPAPTAFPNGQPEAVEGGNPALRHDFDTVRTESVGPIDVMVVADTDLLDDRFWVTYQNFQGQRVAIPGAGNGDFVANALDAMTGSSALLDLRGQGTAYRPFEVMEKLKREADRTYQSKELELRKTLDDTQKKLRGLRERDAVTAGPVALSEEEQATMRNLQGEVLRVRSELRGVQASLRADVERLERELQFVNIALMPILVALFALGLSVMRARQRRRRFETADASA
ncbi:MAG: GldG family protein [Thalassobaculaceae bacterium]|nr:GldG family protein [Thalassobaculaceae bacterium]